MRLQDEVERQQLAMQKKQQFLADERMAQMMMDEEVEGGRRGAGGSVPDPNAASWNEISALADDSAFAVEASDAERRRLEQLRSDEETARLLMEALAVEDGASEHEQRRQSQLQADEEFARMLMESEHAGFSAGHGASGPCP